MKKYFIKNSLYIIFLLLSVVFIFQKYFSNNARSIGNGYNASYVLGQDDFITGSYDNIDPSSSSLTDTKATIIDGVNHKMYVSDAYNARVLVYNLNLSNQPIDAVADYVLGQPDFVSNGCNQVTQSSICSPAGLDINTATNTLFVTDSVGNRVLIFDVTSLSNGMNALGVIGQTDFTSSNCSVNNTNLCTPNDISFDNVNNRLFVSDYGASRVVVINFDPLSYTNGPSFANVLGQVNFNSFNCITTAVGLCLPNGIVYNSETEDLFVSDSSRRVLVYDANPLDLADGDAAINILGQANFTSNTEFGGLTNTSPKGFSFPTDLDLDLTNDRLFVGDTIGRVSVFDISTITDFEDAINVLGMPSFGPSQCQVSISASTFCDVYGVEYSDTNNTLFINDTYRNRVLGFEVSAITDGEDAVSLIGQSNFQEDYDNGISNPNRNGLDGPDSTVIDSKNNRLFVSDMSNSRVLVYDLNTSGNPVDRLPEYVIGAQDFESPTCDDFFVPSASVVCSPAGLAYDEQNDRLFVGDLDYNRVLIFNVAPQNISNGMSASYVLGQADFSDIVCNRDTATDINTLCYPQNLAYDSVDKYLYIADSGNDRVVGYNVSTQTIQNGMDASRILGRDSFTSFGCPNTDSHSLCEPFGVAVNSVTRQLFVSDGYDSNDQRIMGFKIDETFVNGINAFVVLGQSSFNVGQCNAGGTVNINTICYPLGIAVDEQNSLIYVSDSGNSRVVVYDGSDSALVNGADAIAVIGQADFVSTVCLSTPDETSICGPIGLTVDTDNGNLFAVDNNSNRVLQYKFIQYTDTTTFSSLTGQPFSEVLNPDNTQGNDTQVEVSDGVLPPGLSLDSSLREISGTPTQTGKYVFTLKFIDENDGNGYFQSLKTFTILINPELIDYDNDGIRDVIEDAGPNEGDANNDSELDSEQDNVTSIVNPKSGNYSVLESNCISNDSVSIMNGGSLDEAFDYPAGLFDFTLTCNGIGQIATIKQIYYEDFDIGDLVLRKYDSENDSFKTISDYSISGQNVDGDYAITVTYGIIDGGNNDEDGVANGIIIDPSGVGINSIGAPDTGLGGAYKNLKTY